MEYITGHMYTALLVVFVQTILPNMYYYVRELIFGCFLLLINETEYTSVRNRRGIDLVTKALNKRGVIKLGRVVFVKDMKISSVTAGRWFLAYANMVNDHGYETMSIVVYTTRWNKPIISDEMASCKLEPGHMYELINVNPTGSSDLYLVTPPVISRKPSPKAVQMSKNIANIIIGTRASRAGNVFIVSGPPGTGKTFAGRLLAYKLGACLYDEFDPRRKETPFSIADKTHRDDQVLVLVMNECDVVFQTFDKALRNNMLDKVNNNPQKFVLIMTTNRNLEDIYAEDNSLIRDGRVTKMEVSGNGLELNVVTTNTLQDRLHKDTNKKQI